MPVLIKTVGSTEPYARTTLSTRLMGRIKEVTVDEGAVVRKGQMLVQIESKDLTAKRRQAEAGLREAQAVLAEGMEVLRRGGTLVRRGPNADGSGQSAAVGAAAHRRQALAHPWAAARFATSMLLWRVVSSGAGQLGAAQVTELLQTAGFERVATHPTIGGLGLHCVGRKPAIC